MPSNKNALARYMFLDEMLSDIHHFYNIHDLTQRCNEKLVNLGISTVTQRCIEKDIQDLEYDPFYAEIERFRVNGKRCIRYADPSFSIFKKELSDEESNLILEVLNTIGQFEGLAHFEWLDKFRTGLSLKQRPKIISFSNNPYLHNSNLLGLLFDVISNQVVIELEYHKYLDVSNKKILFHPYLLKQYNNRWYLIGSADTDNKVLTFALDRIDKITSRPEITYVPYNGNLAERFEDIVGVTLHEDREMENIVLWASDSAKDYIITKPIHESQKQIKGDYYNELLKKYPHLKNGIFFSIDCIPNYELIRELCAFGKDLLVLEPSSIQEQVVNRITTMIENYTLVRK